MWKGMVQTRPDEIWASAFSSVLLPLSSQMLSLGAKCQHLREEKKNDLLLWPQRMKSAGEGGLSNLKCTVSIWG